MTPILIALALVQSAPSTPTPAAVTASVEPPATPEQTLAGLEQVYSTTCGQTGILYHAYDELCEGLRNQIAAYRKQIARSPAKTAPVKVDKP